MENQHKIIIKVVQEDSIINREFSIQN